MGGLDTLDEYIDQSFQYIDDTELYIKTFLDEVERLCKISDAEWRTMSAAMLPKLVKNRRTVAHSRVFDNVHLTFLEEFNCK